MSAGRPITLTSRTLRELEAVNERPQELRGNRSRRSIGLPRGKDSPTDQPNCGWLDPFPPFVVHFGYAFNGPVFSRSNKPV